MIPVYNRTSYLEQALQSVLAQDPGLSAMQIEVLDDCSTRGDPESIVKSIGKNRVSFYRQPRNMGLSANWTTCIRRARGHWVHILHDDDFVMPEYYQRLREVLEKEPAVGAAFCRYVKMDEDGHWQWISPLERKTPGVLSNWVERIAVSQRIQCPAIIVSRRVYEALGGFHPDLFYAVDWEMWKRIAAHYPVWYEPQPLACFREHSMSHSLYLIQSAAGIFSDTCKAIEVSRSYLPVATVEKLSAKAREFCAFQAIARARDLFVAGCWTVMVQTIWEGLKCYVSIGVIRYLAASLLWAAPRWIRRVLHACVSSGH
jgi:hypothetical protein